MASWKNSPDPGGREYEGSGNKRKRNNITPEIIVFFPMAVFLDP